MPTMYELSEAYSNIAALLDDESMPEEELLDALDAIQDDMRSKALNMARAVKNMEGDVIAIKNEELRLTDRRKGVERRIAKLKLYAQECMELEGADKVQDTLLTVALQNNPPSVVVVDEKILPRKYWVTKPPEISKSAIKADISAGIEVPGAELRQEKSLRIK